MNPSELQFRPARAEDGVLIARLRHKIWQTTYRGIYPDEMLESFDIAWHTQKDIQRILSPDYAVFLIVCGEQPVGYLNLRRGETPHLLSLYVQKEYQNLGIGGKAFAFVREYFRDEGAAFFPVTVSRITGMPWISTGIKGVQLSGRICTTRKAGKTPLPFNFLFRTSRYEIARKSRNAF